MQKWGRFVWLNCSFTPTDRTLWPYLLPLLITCMSYTVTVFIIPTDPQHGEDRDRIYYPYRSQHFEHRDRIYYPCRSPTLWTPWQYLLSLQIPHNGEDCDRIYYPTDPNTLNTVTVFITPADPQHFGHRDCIYYPYMSFTVTVFITMKRVESVANSRPHSWWKFARWHNSFQDHFRKVSAITFN